MVEGTGFLQVKSNSVFRIILVKAGINRVDVVGVAGSLGVEVVLNESSGGKTFANATFVSGDEDKAFCNGSW